MLTIDASQMKRLERTVKNIEKGVPRVLAPAINRALASGKTEIKREIRKEYLIAAKDIPMSVKRATYSTLSGHINIKDKMLELGKFRVTPKGVAKRKRVVLVRAQVKKSGGAKTIARAFIANVGDYTGPFVRKGESHLPVKKLLAISSPIMASQPNVGPAANKRMGDVLAKRIDHEIIRVMNSAGG
jgi:hypothetical protein